MKKIKHIFWIAAVTVFMVSCAGGKKEKESVVTEKKIQLEKLKTDKTKIDEKIKALEAEIAKIDTGAARTIKAKLVTVQPVAVQNFSHFLDLQGKIDAENISYVTPRGMGGQVKALYVKKGDYVRKGQLLLKMDDAVARQNVAAVKQSEGTVRAQLALARSVYQRQKNLWDQNIGTEVQLLQAKSNVETLENQLKTIQQNVKTVQEQLNQSNVYAHVSGVADEVNIHVGETFTGLPMNGIKIVNTSALKVVTDIPENYINRVHKGTPVQIEIPDVKRTFNSTVSVVGQSIGATSRGFYAEAKIPYDPTLKPNQVALMKVLDYSAPNAIAVPVNILQTDEKGKYVLVASKEGDETVARKRMVQPGELYGDRVEIKTGLKQGDLIITEGYQGVYDGQPLMINDTQ